MTQSRKNALPLTQSQSLMWTGQKLNPESPLYNVIHTFDFTGAFHVSNFQRAFQELIDRVDVFRTVFFEEEDVPYQSVLDVYAYEMDFLDFSSKSKDFLNHFIKERSQEVLDLHKPLFDAILIKMSEQRHVWYLNIHHVITDATSSTIIYDVIADLYKQITQGEALNVENAPAFSSYVQFEKTQNTANVSDAKSYWEEKIGALSTVPIFYGKQRKQYTSVSKRISFKLGVKLSKQLKELAKDPSIRGFTEHLTLFNIFSSLLFVFIYRISGQQTIAIGAPSHNRPTKRFKETAGLFIEIFPLLASLSEDDTFNSVLQRAKIESNGFLKNAQAGLADAATSRSFNVILNYINARFSDLEGLEMKSKWIHPGHCDPAHQLRCHIDDFDASGDIEIHFDLNQDVFDDELTKKVPNHFLALVSAFVADINQNIHQPTLIGLEEKTEFLSQFQNNVPTFIPIIRKFKDTAQLKKEATALVFQGKELSYEQLDQKSNQLAHYLRKKGIAKGDRVALYFQRTPEYIISVLAVLKIGGTFIPIPSDQTIKRLSFIVNDSNSAVLITNMDISNKDVDVPIIPLSDLIAVISKEKVEELPISVNTMDPAYMIYTSGSTGTPKGVLIPHAAIANYLNWAENAYAHQDPYIFPLCTSIGFDLTITATFLPLLTGGQLVVYKESAQGPDIAIMEVLEENVVNSIKLTPSHLHLLAGKDVSHSNIKTMIVGGEDFKTSLANKIQTIFGADLRIFNEYGPTEATVGCIVSKFDARSHLNASVPIGKPIAHMHAYVLDSHKNLVPKGVAGVLYLGGIGLASGYANASESTSKKFLADPFIEGARMYETGDLVRINKPGEFEFLGRVDEQVKLRGYRIELEDIEANLISHATVENCSVVVLEKEKVIPENEVINCMECGLPSNYPETDFNEQGVCHICTAFRGYKEKAQQYFKTKKDLVEILSKKRTENSSYDCLSLLSGGKDSTYVLAQLIGMGLKVLAFTLDNGYISDQAKANVDRIVSKLRVDHIYGTTEYMNKIFVDSLHRHQNVCNGCFKTIYTLSTQIALEKQIPFVVTGLSRGQFFETRLTEELFWDEKVDAAQIDRTILEARKLYHQEEDAVKSLLDVSMFEKEDTFEKVQFVDFYRYSDVSLEEMLRYLEEKVGWVRPTDTGRSTNCLINQLGIYVHKKQKGYSNYSFPYSWDVRMGHKTRTETLDEINEVIDEGEVKRIMSEIGYSEPAEEALHSELLVGYYTGSQKVSSKELSAHLKKELPEYMIPQLFKHLEELPLTSNGKIDKSVLRKLNAAQLEMDTPYIAPRGEIEELLAAIWSEVLKIKQVGVHDNFISLGGHSLAAIQTTARINEELEIELPLNKVFEFPTVEQYSAYIENTLIELLQ